MVVVELLDVDELVDLVEDFFIEVLLELMVSFDV